MIYDLKILPIFFDQQIRGLKDWELRKYDRNFEAGDILNLREHDGESFTGRVVSVGILSVFKGGEYGLSKEYCILSTKVII